MENKIKQLRKGILELAVLGALEDSKHYGYSLVKTITRGRQVPINEGTIYPILSRLAKEELVHTEWVESNQGPPRKYYSISLKGKKAYDVLSEECDKLIELVKNVKFEKKENNKNKTKSKKTLDVKKEKKNEQEQ